jgi:hypothetical protein
MPKPMIEQFLAAKNGNGMSGFSLSFSGSSLARLLKSERPPSKIELHMIDADRAQLFVDGWPAMTGSLEKATAIMRQLGFETGDEYKMITATGKQAIVRLRTAEERANGVSAIARRLSKEEIET